MIDQTISSMLQKSNEIVLDDYLTNTFIVDLIRLGYQNEEATGARLQHLTKLVDLYLQWLAKTSITSIPWKSFWNDALSINNLKHYAPYIQLKINILNTELRTWHADDLTNWVDSYKYRLSNMIWILPEQDYKELCLQLLLKSYTIIGMDDALIALSNIYDIANGPDYTDEYFTEARKEWFLSSKTFHKHPELNFIESPDVLRIWALSVSNKLENVKEVSQYEMPIL